MSLFKKLLSSIPRYKFDIDSPVALMIQGEAYQKVQPLSEGQLGQALLYENPTGQKLVIKTLKSKEVSSHSPPQLEDVYRPELKALSIEARRSKLTGLPEEAVVPVASGTFETHGPGGAIEVPFVASPYIDGVTLKERLSNGVDLQTCISYTRQLLELFSRLASKGVKFLDLHDENIMVQNDRLYLIDFGASLLSTEGETVSSRSYSRYNTPLAIQRIPFRPAHQDAFSIGRLVLSMMLGFDFFLMTPDNPQTHNGELGPHPFSKPPLRLKDDLDPIEIFTANQEWLLKPEGNALGYSSEMVRSRLLAVLTQRLPQALCDDFVKVLVHSHHATIADHYNYATSATVMADFITHLIAPSALRFLVSERRNYRSSEIDHSAQYFRQLLSHPFLSLEDTLPLGVTKSDDESEHRLPQTVETHHYTELEPPRTAQLFRNMKMVVNEKTGYAVFEIDK